ncbi:hypothetical protein [Cupriavidus sp. TMH.W2]|uniref:hypothetical protein n=1 Tax=Cupriavidus sp. TMH.W2 TaxID=3434465 RepID=UPI003D77B97C
MSNPAKQRVTARSEFNDNAPYFRERLERVLAGIDRYTREELARELSRIASVANHDVALKELSTPRPGELVAQLANKPARTAALGEETDQGGGGPACLSLPGGGKALTNAPAGGGSYDLIAEIDGMGSRIAVLLEAERHLLGKLSIYEQALTQDKLGDVFIAGILKMGHTIDDEHVTFHRACGSEDNALRQLSDAVVSTLVQFVSTAVGESAGGAHEKAVSVIRRSHGFTVKTDGELLGLTEGDLGYEGTGLKIDMTGWLEVAGGGAGAVKLSQEQASVGWRWRPAKSDHWTYVDGHPSDDQHAWLSRFGHRFESLFTAPVKLGAALPDGEKLLEIARVTGLRSAMHGVRACDAREMLSTFVREVASADRLPVAEESSEVGA